MLAPAVLITLGALFLLDNLGAIGFHSTWPVLLIVIGIIKVLQYTAPTENHRPRGLNAAVVPPVPPAGELPPNQGESRQGGEGVQNV
ncbi:MAG TPA: DUF5668 domain-containing protein [Clostridia bacterium]|nr:DUF5668 domain-containing protein [Clostridia bacterium]